MKPLQNTVNRAADPNFCIFPPKEMLPVGSSFSPPDSCLNRFDPIANPDYLLNTDTCGMYLPCLFIDDYISMQKHMLAVQRSHTGNETVLTGLLFPWAYFTSDQISSIEPYFPEVAKQLKDDGSSKFPRGFVAFHNNSVSSTLELLELAQDGSGGGGESCVTKHRVTIDEQMSMILTVTY